MRSAQVAARGTDRLVQFPGRSVLVLIRVVKRVLLYPFGLVIGRIVHRQAPFLSDLVAVVSMFRALENLHRLLLNLCPYFCLGHVTPPAGLVVRPVVPLVLPPVAPLLPVPVPVALPVATGQ